MGAMKPAAYGSVRGYAARLALLLLPLVGLAGCDAITGSDDEASIEGTWVLTEGSSTLYLEITDTTVTVYDGVAGECFDIMELDIVGRDGATYTLEDPDSGYPVDVFMRVVDGQLSVGEPEGDTDPELYAPSDQDVSQLEECVYTDGGGGTDPAIDCSSLPAITVGQSIDGELTTSDPVFEGNYFDLYGLTLDASTEVRIDLTSRSIDAYLFLYESDGTYIDEDDDGGADLDASLTTTLPAGCYRIEATSYFGDETGPYTLSVN